MKYNCYNSERKGVYYFTILIDFSINSKVFKPTGGFGIFEDTMISETSMLAKYTIPDKYIQGDKFNYFYSDHQVP